MKKKLEMHTKIIISPQNRHRIKQDPALVICGKAVASGADQMYTNPPFIWDELIFNIFLFYFILHWDM